MSTQKETIEHILLHLYPPERFHTKAMFGEYALYADGKTVALVCNDLLYVKITDATYALKGVCDTDSPFRGAKLHYVVEEEQLQTIEDLSDILLSLSATLPNPKAKKK